MWLINAAVLKVRAVCRLAVSAAAVDPQQEKGGRRRIYASNVM